MRRSFVLTVVPALLLTLSSIAHADDASKRTKVEQMLTVTKVDSLSQQMLASVPDRVKAAASRQMMVQSASTPEQKKLTDDYLSQMQTIARSGATWVTLKPKIIDIYMASFTEPELDSILAFYKTPAGQTLITKTPEVSGKTIETLQSAVSALQPQFEAATKAYQTSMQNASPTGGAAGGSSSDAAPRKPPTLGPETPAGKPATPKK